jgi:hypothetical protein
MALPILFFSPQKMKQMKNRTFGDVTPADDSHVGVEIQLLTI